jgi:hypothetical protein
MFLGKIDRKVTGLFSLFHWFCGDLLNSAYVLPSNNPHLIPNDTNPKNSVNFNLLTGSAGTYNSCILPKEVFDKLMKDKDDEVSYLRV